MRRLGFTNYLRDCKYCNTIFKSENKSSRVCDNCNKIKTKTKLKKRGDYLKFKMLNKICKYKEEIKNETTRI